MMTSNQQIGLLLYKHLQGTLTAAEAYQLDAWRNADPGHEWLASQLEQEASLSDAIADYHPDNRQLIADSIFEKVLAQCDDLMKAPAPLPVRRLRWWRHAVAAATVLLILGTAWIYFASSRHSASLTPHAFTAALIPGTSHAVLTLANGQQIVVDSADNGLLTQEGTATITKKANGELAYQSASNKASAAPSYNTLSVPRGSKTAQLRLADGSVVILNAASSIRYPVVFSGPDRQVTIMGEAYFEVAHDPQHPFKVIADGLHITVLGTHFNINAYDDETTTRVTLLQGKVKVGSGAHSPTSIVLHPGQQASLSNIPIPHTTPGIGVQTVDTAAVTAWKHGYFLFDHTDLAAVMRQVSRWYAVEVVYEGKIPDMHFGGEVSRNISAQEVLKVLEASHVRFRIEGKKIIVMK